MGRMWNFRRQLAEIIDNIRAILDRINFLSEDISLVNINAMEGCIRHIQVIDVDDEYLHAENSIRLLEEYKKLM
jgi:radical SAM superfamily enzyme YgiQ (UPF0313 family)